MKLYSKHIIFKDIVNVLYHSIKNLGYKVSITDKIIENTAELYILIGVAEFVDNKPKNYIVYQFEQTNILYKNKRDIWFTEKYIDLLQSAQYIWDYSKSNIEYLNQNFNISKNKLIYVPLRYSTILDQFPKKKKDIDILFLGSNNKRRDDLLDILKDKYNLHIANNNLWDQERDILVSRSKIIVNIQFYDNGLLELPRLSYLLSGDSFIVSEWGREISLRKEMSNYIILCPYNKIIDNIDKFLNNEELRLKQQKIFRNNWKQTKYIENIPIKCFDNIEKGFIKKKGKIHYYIPKNIESVEFNVTDDGHCILNLPKIIDDNLPYVSIITPTRNRKLFFKLAIYNFNRFIYPREKLEWIIVDNGEENLCDILPIDNRIRYIKLDHSKQYSVAYMRNRCISESKHDIICYMDDDDIYRPESILSRVKSLIKYKNNGIECVGCTQVGCFNIINGQSVLGTNNQMYLSEASMAHTKSFWLKRCYDNNDKLGEFKHFLLYRQEKILAIPYQFVMIALNHKTNTTGKLRNFKNYSKWIEKHSSDKNFSFFDMFDTDIQIIINEIIKKLNKK